MADLPWDRTIIRTLEKTNCVDINQLQSQQDRTLRDLVSSLFAGPNGTTGDYVSSAAISGFVGDGLRVGFLPGTMTALIWMGIGFQGLAAAPVAIDGVAGVDDKSPYKPLPLTYPQVVAIDAAPGAGTRYDLIEVRADMRVENPVSRSILDVALRRFSPGSVNKTLSWALDGRLARVVSPADSTAAIGYKVGSGSTRPTPTAGYVPLAYVVVPTGTTALTARNFHDERSILAPGNQLRVVGEVGINTTSGGTPNITSLKAYGPAGFEVYAYFENYTGGQVSLLIVGGKPDYEIFPRVQALGINVHGQVITSIVSDLSRQAAAAAPNDWDALFAANPTMFMPTNARRFGAGTGIVHVGWASEPVNAGTLNDPIVYGFDITLVPGMVTEASYT